MKSQTSWRTRVVAGVAAVLGLGMIPGAADAQLVISQVYGGGGNSGAQYHNDFIELFNRGTTAVDLTGMSVQYGAATGTTWTNVTVLPSAIVPPGAYFLIQEAAGTGGGAVLPTPDATGTINMSGTAGKVALVNGTTSLSGACPTGPTILDFVGYGATANCFEGAAAAPGLSNTTAAFRGDGGCVDTNNNGADFAALAPNPRNSASPTHECTPSTPPSGSGSSDPASQCPGFDVTLTVAVTLGGGPSSPISSVVGDLSAIGGSPTTSFLDDGVAPDQTAGDLVYTATGTVATGTPTGNRSVPVTITDNLNRTGNASITVNVLNCNPRASASSRGLCNDETAVLTVEVTPGIMPPSTGTQVFVDMTSFDGSGLVNFVDDGTGGDVTAGDDIFSRTVTVPSDRPAGTAVLSGGVLDEQGRSGTFTFSLSTAPCVQTTAAVVISQVYGGGGNQGGVFRNDFIEVFNRSNAPVDITGWSVQYASGSDPTQGFNQKTDLAGVIPAGGYYLVQEAAGADTTQPVLPAADAVGTIPMGLGSGRVALVNDGVLIGNCPITVTTVMDFIGYGTVECYEGVIPAPLATNPVSEHRRDDGCFDTDNNGIDFFTATPTPRNSASPVHLCAPPPPVCPCNWNHDAFLNSQDFFDFLNSFFGPGGADFNNDGISNSQDFFDFLNCFFAPPPDCP